MQYTVKPGFVPGMRVPGTFYVNEQLKSLLYEELQQSVQRGQVGCRLLQKRANCWVPFTNNCGVSIL